MATEGRVVSGTLVVRGRLAVLREVLGVLMVMAAIGVVLVLEFGS